MEKVVLASRRFSSSWTTQLRSLDLTGEAFDLVGMTLSTSEATPVTHDAKTSIFASNKQSAPRRSGISCSEGFLSSGAHLGETSP